jgi:hypothetical protein
MAKRFEAALSHEKISARACERFHPLLSPEVSPTTTPFRGDRTPLLRFAV